MLLQEYPIPITCCQSKSAGIGISALHIRFDYSEVWLWCSTKNPPSCRMFYYFFCLLL